MNHSTLTSTAGFMIETQPRRNLRTVLSDWYTGVVRRHRQHRAISELRSLDAHLLRDMGLHRGMIVDVVINGDPRRSSNRTATPTTATPKLPAPVVPANPVDAWARHAAASNGFGG